jgi:hypothetical protein
VLRYAPNGTRARAIVDAADAASAIDWAQALRARSVIGEFSLTPASLEDVYVELVSPRPSDAPAEADPASPEEVAHARAA